ncbi:hypothetical protein [Haloechinothrix halophila]|uniref:hypothetical protein n=1 Tax=Haloechinothrix halophila TaxID=1069073 RepID=UPI0012FA7A81|nr:hypothetical protein [Haloechinothrix halophila]
MASEAGLGNLDGTQPLAPATLYPDPTAGLVTSDSDISASAFAARYDDLEVPIAQPVEADQEAIKAMTEAVLADIDEPSTGRSRSRQHQTRQDGGAPPGMMARPRPASARMRNALRSSQGQGNSGNGISLPKPTLTPKKTNSGAVIVAIVLIVVFGMIALQVIGGIIEAIGGSLD